MTDNKKTNDEVANIAKDYYDSEDADNFYHIIWGGEDLHIGIYESATEDIRKASRRTVETMAKIANLTQSSRVLDMGAGYGGAARYLAGNFGCNVTCFNLSSTENNRNEQKNKEQGLDDKVSVVQGNFEDMPFEDQIFDVVWSEDAILHSGNKPQVFREAARVLKPGGSFIFTDPMQDDNVPDGVLSDVYARIHLDSMGSFGQYKQMATDVNLEPKSIQDMTDHLTRHYTRVREELTARKSELEGHVSDAYIDKMLEGLGHWIRAGQAGHLSWGILHFTKPS